MGEYSLRKNEWRHHSGLPQPMAGSSAVVLRGVIYNIGGDYSIYSILWYDLSSASKSTWITLDLLHHNFQGHYDRKASVVEGKIIYFGSCKEDSTFVLERDNYSKELRVVEPNRAINFTFEGNYST